MNDQATRLNTCAPEAFQLRFTSLFHTGRALAFPCDAAGEVVLDSLSDRARTTSSRARWSGASSACRRWCGWRRAEDVSRPKTKKRSTWLRFTS
jgi:hypothetical protein